ncbi:MAG: response regulator [Candidatus Bathyarchaeota archaeon]|nr:response regulator [Candidatus Bathyarchaeota archaeon]
MDEKEKNILVVDDDKAILEDFKELLESQGYSADTAENGREAMEKFNDHLYDLALLDIKLPDMEGTELLIKLHQKIPRTMKIMITGYPSFENAVESLNLGADAYIMKPVDPKKLLKVVEEKLREQEEAESMTGEKVKEWVESRSRLMKDRVRSLAAELQSLYEKSLKETSNEEGRNPKVS